MKKSRSMRLASALLVCTLLSTCMISGTFAKYTTQDSGKDEARVAKWGVELQVSGNLYGDTYKETTNVITNDADGFSVQSLDAFQGTNSAADVVAPGTKNDEGFTFSLKGQPEVSGEVITEMKIQRVFLKENQYGVMIPIAQGVVTEDNFDEFTQPRYTKNKKFEELPGLYYLDGDNYYFTKEWLDGKKYYTLEDCVKLTGDYYPVEYSLTGNTSYNDNGAGEGKDTLKNIADLIAAQLGISKDTTKTKLEVDAQGKQNTTVVYYGEKSFTPNTNLDKWKIDGLKLTWEWDFEQSTSNETGDKAQDTDKADTILGLLKNTTDGIIVKLDHGSTSALGDDSFVPVVEFEDYCLDTQFSIDITVTQVD